MRISGFTFVKNAVKLDYPIVEAITSILPICDEFIVAAGDSDDNTTELIKEINDPKIKIIETLWDPKYFVHGAINAQQTNIALEQCTGDWCFYIQADEVVHEKYLPIVKKCMEENLDRQEVEGLLFHYLHFWGDYWHYHNAHNWYSREIRVIRNGIGIESWKSAQSFRKNGEKLKVIDSGAYIYHYGWVRHPMTMKKKQIALDSVHHDKDWVDKKHPKKDIPFDYGPIDHLPVFKGTHPKVMEERIQNKEWDAADFRGSGYPKQHRHNKLSQRILTFIEQKILGGRKLGEYKNYIEIN